MAFPFFDDITFFCHRFWFGYYLLLKMNEVNGVIIKIFAKIIKAYSYLSLHISVDPPMGNIR